MENIFLSIVFGCSLLFFLPAIELAIEKIPVLKKITDKLILLTLLK